MKRGTSTDGPLALTALAVTIAIEIGVPRPQRLKSTGEGADHQAARAETTGRGAIRDHSSGSPMAEVHEAGEAAIHMAHPIAEQAGPFFDIEASLASQRR